MRFLADTDGERVDVFLARQSLPYSRSQLARRIEEGEVTVAGQNVRPGRRLRPGEEIVFRPADVVPSTDLPEDIPLSILFEDRHLIVVDKPAGMVVHPATSHDRGTLVNALLHHCGDELVGVGGERRPGIVHRIDKDTSGVLVVAKDEPTLVALQVLFAAHDVNSIRRRYLALVEGVVAEKGTIRSGYGRDPHDRKKFTSRLPGGKRAVTHWECKERFPGATLLEARLETGRTHQIRVHFRDAGHPLLGDQTYGRPPRLPTLRPIAETLGRQALHAFILGFVHPATGKYLEWQSPLPADLVAAISALRQIK